MSETESGPIEAFVVSGLPHILLCPEKNEGWMEVRRAYEAARDALQASGADVIVVYSTMWPSVIGHQIQARPEPEVVLRTNDHSWFAALVAPEGDRPRYAICVLMEHAGSGGRVSGPVTNQIIHALIAEGYLEP